MSQGESVQPDKENISISKLDIAIQLERFLPEEFQERFLLEGAEPIGRTQFGEECFAFVDMYNADYWDHEKGGRANENYRSSVTVADVKTGKHREYKVKDRSLCTTAVFPTDDENILRVATNKGIYSLDLTTGEYVEWDRPKFIDDWDPSLHSRPNDCSLIKDHENDKVYMLIGWRAEGHHLTAESPHKRPASLYLYDPETKDYWEVNNDSFIPNGHECVQDAKGRSVLLYNDTANEKKTNATHRYIIDFKDKKLIPHPDGDLIDYGRAATPDEEKHNPDGNDVDAEGRYMFVAHWNKSGFDAVEVASGKRVAEVPVPNAPKTSTLAFVGEWLVVLTATEGDTPDDLKEPGNANAGGIFRAKISQFEGLHGPKEPLRVAAA